MSSLKRKLLALLLPVMIVLLCGELWLNHRSLTASADAAYDRSLAGAIRAIDANISTASGGLGVELPYRMLEFFELTASGRVFYRITTDDGLVTLGNADLPAFSAQLRPGIPYFYDARYFGEPIRVGVYMRRLDKPLYGSDVQHVIIQVAEGIQSRSAFAKGLLVQAAILDALLVLAIALLMMVGIVFALRPLQRLQREVEGRDQDDLAPIDAASVPAEVRPLVDAINHHVDRSAQLIRSQRQFLDDASHQLRTPLAVLRTQVGYAMREPEFSRVREALNAMERGLDRAVRLVNQLLALARINNAGGAPDPMEKIELNGIVEDIARMLLPEARRKEQDFGLVRAPDDIYITGAATLLQEALANVVDNAIRYVPERGSLTLSVTCHQGMGQVTVIDDGPGMTTEERMRIGERFRRGKNAPPGGAGLGLAIAKAIIEQHGGRFEVDQGPGAIGLMVRFSLPLFLENGLHAA